jgi:acetyltransferase-like isoleucine patch superfamily enzyme
MRLPLNRTEAADQHDRLVEMYRQQDEFRNDPVIYDNVIQLRPENITIGEGSRIDSFVKLEGGENLIIGRFVHIASFSHIGIGGGITYIGDYAAVASGGKLISGSNDVFARSMSAVAPKSLQRITKAFVCLKDFAVVLTNGVVLPGVTLHEGAILAAGGVATKDIPAWEVWGGVPAKFMFKRIVK